MDAAHTEHKSAIPKDDDNRTVSRDPSRPIYVAFALTLWTVPVSTPDQLVLGLMLTTYCLAADLALV